MAGAADERFAFIAEWYDANAAIVRRYELLFYPKDNSIEMVDLKQKKMFLRRSKVDTPTMLDMYIGSTVCVYGRQLKLVDYADGFTQKNLGSAKESTFIRLPARCDKLGELLDLVFSEGFLVTRMKMLNEGIVLEAVGDGAISRIQRLTSPSDSLAEEPKSVRARYGDFLMTSSACVADANRDIEAYFGSATRGQNTAMFSDSTLCIIKPHAVLSGAAGKIIQQILDANFEISAMSMFQVPRDNAEEFLEVYKGVVHEYLDMVQELIAGPCIALEIRAKDAHLKFREFCGPYDPEIARQLRPRTLRALFGESKVKNAVHCTDLPEDCPLEVEYFFRILDQ